jgi:hypothetical protein
MLVCIRIHSDYFTFFIECVSFFKGVGAIFSRSISCYTDEHYDVSLSIDKDGKPKIERIYGNKRLGELKGALKVFVKAEGFSETEQMLHQFKEALPSGASIAQNF